MLSTKGQHKLDLIPSMPWLFLCWLELGRWGGQGMTTAPGMYRGTGDELCAGLSSFTSQRWWH